MSKWKKKKAGTFCAKQRRLWALRAEGADTGGTASGAMVIPKSQATLSLDWFCWENFNRKPMGFYHQI